MTMTQLWTPNRPSFAMSPYGALVGACRPKMQQARGPILSDSFPGGSGAALSGLWTAQLGTFVVNGSGKARGSALAADGIEILPNGEFSSDLANWLPGDGATITRRDFASSPAIAPTGGVDDFGVDVATGGADTSKARQSIYIGTNGETYRLAVRAYSPSGNVETAVARLGCQGLTGATMGVSADDIWQTLTVSGPGDAAGIFPYLFCASSTVGDVAYFDAASLQALYAIATCNPATANVDIRVPVTLPASGVVPFGIVARYLNPSNYWLWRIKPGTTGTDFELIEVNAGVATQRASADIDWVAGSTYSLRFTHTSGNVYTAYVDGVQKLTYTDGSAFNATETLFGLLEAGATNGLFGTWEVYAL